MPRVAVAECVMTSQCIVCLAINSSLRMQVRKGAGAEVVYGVVWCGCVFAFVGEGKIR